MRSSYIYLYKVPHLRLYVRSITSKDTSGKPSVRVTKETRQTKNITSESWLCPWMTILYLFILYRSCIMPYNTSSIYFNCSIYTLLYLSKNFVTTHFVSNFVTLNINLEFICVYVFLVYTILPSDVTFMLYSSFHFF